MQRRRLDGHARADQRARTLADTCRPARALSCTRAVMKLWENSSLVTGRSCFTQTSPREKADTHIPLRTPAHRRKTHPRGGEMGSCHGKKQSSGNQCSTLPGKESESLRPRLR